MRKVVSAAPREPRSRRPVRIPWARLIVAGLASPFLYELGLICHARWMSLLGPSRVARTPALDRAAELARSAWSGLGAQFDRVPWSPSLVVVVGAAWAVFCGWMFRRR